MPPPQRQRRTCLLLVAIPLSLLAALIFFVYSCNNPRDRVLVTVTGVPKDVDLVFPVVESGGQISGMKAYAGGVFGPFVLSELQSLDKRSDAGGFGDPIAWLPGERYGMITMTNDGEWRIVWFNADAVQLTDRSLLVGGGSATFDLSRGQAEKLSDKEVTRLGLSQYSPGRKR